MENRNYYLGLDIGTDSVGYAATDLTYSLKKYKQEPVWGVTLFEEAQLNADRRMHRTARRALERKKHRVMLVQELMAPEILKTDRFFFVRMRQSRLQRDEADSRFTLFDEAGFTDCEYSRKYPTIHHLINELMTSDEPHDVRLVYLACVWLVAHRGHFLSEVNRENIAALTDFSGVWNVLTEYLQSMSDEVELPCQTVCSGKIGEILKKKVGVTSKYKQLCSVLFENAKVPKYVPGFPYQLEQLLKGLCGGKMNASALFANEEYQEIPSFSLADADEKIADVLGKLGDDGELIVRMKSVYDWAMLVDILDGELSISKAKVKTYEQHEADLKLLKRIVRDYLPDQYNDVFKKSGLDNYPAYVGHFAAGQEQKRTDKENFSKWLSGILKKVEPQEADAAAFSDMMDRLSTNSFLPKQHDTDNRVIPYQLYWYELNMLLHKAEGYLPFLADRDESGFSVSEKILSIFTFRIPYYVGPLNKNSSHGWLVRKSEGRILPWTFDNLVDKDASEEKFIRRMTNQCTYMPGEDVLPRESLMYHKFVVLNEINNLKIDGVPIPVDVKKGIYTELFEKRRKVTVKAIRGYLESNNYMQAGQTLSGVDDAIHSDLRSFHDFRQLLSTGLLNEAQTERIIERITCTEDKLRLKRWLKKEYPVLSEHDIDYIARLNYKDFGRLSAAFLNQLEGVDRQTGEIFTILKALWETNCNLMELLSSSYSFTEVLENLRKEYYAEKSGSLERQLEDMYLSNAVKRPVRQALEIVTEVTKALGMPPARIFVETTRGAKPEQKNRRTKTRRQQLEELYAKCDAEDVRILQQQLSDMGDSAETQLQSEALFLYYTQLGRCMYTGESIQLSELKTARYNIDHVYPQRLVKDDSVINNKVLVLSETNGLKSDRLVPEEYRRKMRPFWERLRKAGLLSDEKYRRLTRTTDFTEQEKLGFINRQLTETSQAVKAVTAILQQRYPQTEIVFVKAQLSSEFRQDYNLIKSRLFNDLHHAKDAYLAVVVGNVYHMRFTRRWFDANSQYNVQLKSILSKPVICGDEIVWDGEPMLGKVCSILQKNNAHVTKYAFCRKGGLFDQQPVKAADGLIPLKKGLPTEKYGGYNGAAISFFILVRYACGKKKDIMIMPVELLFADRFLQDNDFAVSYCKDRVATILGKHVDEVSFPLGMRILKINTMFSLDGFRTNLGGSSSKGRGVIMAPFMMFAQSSNVEMYLKKLEMLVEKVKNNEHYQYSEQYDKVSKEENAKMYRMYAEKLATSIYSKRPNSPLNALHDGADKFAALDVIDQAKALLNIHQVFGRVSGGVDLEAIGGSKRAAATVNTSSNMSNWTKTYKDVRIIDTSTSGLWEKKSVNLLELL